MQKLAIILSLMALAFSAACGSAGSGSNPGKVIKSAPAGNNLTVEISNEDGVLKHGDAEFFVTFKDSSGKPVDVGAVALNFFMPAMGSMTAMNNAATFTTTGTPGVYRGKAKIEMAGEWQAQITYEGPAGKGQANVPMTAQ
jgi:hypothetical protein